MDLGGFIAKIDQHLKSYKSTKFGAFYKKCTIFHYIAGLLVIFGTPWMTFRRYYSSLAFLGLTSEIIVRGLSFISAWRGIGKKVGGGCALFLEARQGAISLWASFHRQESRMCLPRMCEYQWQYGCQMPEGFIWQK